MTSYLKSITTDSHWTLQTCVNGIRIKLPKAEHAAISLFQVFRQSDTRTKEREKKKQLSLAVVNVHREKFPRGKYYSISGPSARRYEIVQSLIRALSNCFAKDEIRTETSFRF